jgi:hypothetical protein
MTANVYVSIFFWCLPLGVANWCGCLFAAHLCFFFVVYGFRARCWPSCRHIVCVLTVLHENMDNFTLSAPIQWVPGTVSPEVKRPGREADHSPPTSAEVKKMWIYTSTPPYAFMA